MITNWIFVLSTLSLIPLIWELDNWLFYDRSEETIKEVYELEHWESIMQEVNKRFAKNQSRMALPLSGDNPEDCD